MAGLQGFTAVPVGELVAHMKGTLEGQYEDVMVEGEVSNLSLAHSGHWYFTLSDDEASLSCALFKGDALRNPLIKNLRDGEKLMVYGSVTIFSKRGSLQIVAKQIAPAGEGAAKLRLEALKRKLQGEGLFDADRKRSMPLYPKKVAVITALRGAALQDFLNVYRRRALHWNITIVPALVQGAKAPQSLITALEVVESEGSFDVVVLTRGGGSSEDLAAFNDEALVRRLATCSFPILSAVGHQVDWTLCDHVADLRCETPTAAAETLTQPQTELKQRLSFIRGRLASALAARKNELSLWRERYHPRHILAVVSGILQQQQLHTDDLGRRLPMTLQSRLQHLRQRVVGAEALLRGLGPRAVLARGYTYVTNVQGEFLQGIDEWKRLPEKTKVSIHFHDGVGRACSLGEDV